MSRLSLLVCRGTAPLLLLLAASVSAQSPLLPARHVEALQKLVPPGGDELLPTSPNPYLSLRRQSGNANTRYWRTRMAEKARQRAAQADPAELRMVRVRGRTMTFIPRFGTQSSQVDSAEIDGRFELPGALPLVPDAEDEGDIRRATETGVKSGQGVRIDARIGDGPFGASTAAARGNSFSGDFDFFRIAGVRRGQRILVDIDTAASGLDAYVELWDARGNFIAANDDENAATLDSLLLLDAPADGDYYVSVGGFGAFGLMNPFDSASGYGLATGFGSEGAYTATIGLDYHDDHEFLFFSRRGDVIGAAIDGTLAELSLYDRSRTRRQTAIADNSGIAPAASPLPGGLAAVSHVVDRWGWFYLRLRGVRSGDYTLSLRTAVPTLARSGHDVQTLFLDFDGATVDLGESLSPGAAPGRLLTTLSPLSAFLGRWGLTAADEDALITAIIGVVRRSLIGNIRHSGDNPRFHVRLLNSRDHLDPFGMRDVSRVIIGGTVEELLGIDTIGIAQSVDVGNFDTEETAFVLLDMLSNPMSGVSLLGFPMSPRTRPIDVIARGVGEIVAHEAGHLFGNWHTDPHNRHPNLMDQGGNLAYTILGVGPDGVVGTGDDVDVRFGRDYFAPDEGFRGVENTLATIAWSVTKPRYNRPAGGD